MEARRPAGGMPDRAPAGSAASLAIREHLRAGREEEARLALVDATRDSAYRFLRRLLRDPAAAEDLLQETYLRAFRALGAFRGDSSPTTWVLTISRNLALNRIRRTRLERRQQVNIEEAPEVADSSGPTGAGRTGEATREILAQGRLLKALDGLPAAQREAVLLYYVEDLPVETVSGMTGRPVNTVKSDLRRARQALREILDRKEAGR